MKKIVFFSFLAVLFVSIGTLVWATHAVHRPLPLVKSEIIELPQGSGTRALVDFFEESGLFEHPFLVRLTVRYYGYAQKLKAGEYMLEPGMSFKDALDKIVSGKVVMHHIRLPEGKTTAQFLEIINQEPLLKGDITIKAEEGTLMPETYTFHKGESRDQIVRHAQNAMKKALKQAWKYRQDALPLKSKEELLILASIIEKETGRSDERAMVASVFVNRLNKGMLLQTDPTVIYALTQGKTELGRSLKRKDLEVDSPYNTYKYKGLPPAPICNPSLASLQAAAHPEDTPYFYFVANGEGGHNFSKTLSQHNLNIKAWLKKIRK